MKITLEMVGAMRKPLGQGPVEVETEEGTTVERFMTERLGYRSEHVPRLSYFIDGEAARPSAVLTAGCRLRILMIIGGG
ncbi:MAG: hypothetical protein PHN82_08335 [bacterium]|nr:hypothetical protein [bacterium]